MKKIITFLFVAVLGLNMANAQDYGSTPDKCKENLSLYRSYYTQKSYNDAVKYWKVVYKICPAASERSYVDGSNLIEFLIKNEKDATQKELLIDSLFLLYDNRVVHFGKEGYVLGRKATDMLKYRPDDVAAILATAQKSYDLQGEQTEAGTLVTYMQAAVLSEKKGEKTAADIVAAFTNVSNVISANASNPKTGKYYAQAEESISGLAGPYLSCDVLVDMANKNYDANKDNATWLENTANLLDRKGCSDNEIFFKIAKKMHAINPNAVSAEKMGIMSLKGKQYNDAVKFFNQALELSTDQNKKADYYIELAQTYSSMGQFAQARTMALKAAGARSGFGLPYIIIGDMYASSTSCGEGDACKQKAIYWLAIETYAKAKAIDGSLAQTANNKIATYSKYTPNKEECFFIGVKEGDTVEIGCWINASTTAKF
jgi:tetratricopeptide (TPR) repeat protein